MFNRIFTAVVALICAVGCGMVGPTDLRTEYQKGDVLVEAGSAPRMSWINSSEQTACQIIVSKNKNGKDPVWDSGKIDSGESHLVPYGGPALEPMTDYYWAVRTWDGKGKATKWSEPARWTTGPAANGWDAQWIGAPWQEDVRGNWYTRYPMFRKEFNVGANLVSANMFISGLGYFEARINGGKVGDDFLAPGLTDYTLRPFLRENPRIPLDPEVTAYRTLYLSYDITNQLKQGANAIGVTLGNGYFHTRPTAQSAQCEPYGVPRLIARIELTYKDGHREHISTDTSWKAAESPFIFGDIWQGEAYDAREEQPGWDKAGFDDSAWASAVVRTTPDGPLTANNGPTDKVTEVFKPVSFEKQADGSYKVDFGTVISGWTRFNGIKGNAGDTLKVEYLGEYASPRCEYIFAGNDPVDFAPRFTWFVFREAIVSGLKDLDASQITAEAVNTNVPVNSSFSSSNPLFEQILTIFQRSQMDNMHSAVASDCPHRERLPYTGDGEVAMAAVLSSFDAASFYNKWIGDVIGSQNPETGYVPNGAPWEPMCGGGPAWGAAICVMPWEFYLRYGDKSLLENSFEGMKGYVKYLGTWTRPDGTILVAKATPDGQPFYWYNLGDWLPPQNNEIPSEALIHTFVYWICVRNVAWAAGVLGDKAAEKEYSELRDKIAASFNETFYDKDTKSYGDNGSNVLALYIGVPADRLEDVKATLREELMVKNNGHLNTGIIGTRYLFETLAMNGMGDVAYTIMNQRDFPSFGWWIEQGATTSWEQWNGKDSRNHPMFGGGLTWFSNMLAGVVTDPEKPGFKHFIVRPMPVKDLPEVNYSTQTPYGTVATKVTHDGQTVKVEVTVPFGSTATVYVPKSLDAAMSAPLSDDSYTIHEVGQGHFVF
ncbi:MAG: alpha-L-rhamnosidase N-terminal domain-containing protein [Bacteroidales bacterium]|nr:alpha-L-rhamnosidase N-terminal domain-containing protein [Bacteroidales bacterium]